MRNEFIVEPSEKLTLENIFYLSLWFFKLITFSMLKRIKTESPEHVGIVETVWGGGEPKRKSPKKNELGSLFADLIQNEDKNQTWTKIKSKYSKGQIINSPGIMKFLLRCINGMHFYLHSMYHFVFNVYIKYMRY